MRKRNRFILVSIGVFASLCVLFVDWNGMDVTLVHHQFNRSDAKEDEYLTVHASDQSQTRTSKGRYCNCKLL